MLTSCYTPRVTPGGLIPSPLAPIVLAHLGLLDRRGEGALAGGQGQALPAGDTGGVGAQPLGHLFKDLLLGAANGRGRGLFSISPSGSSSSSRRERKGSSSRERKGSGSSSSSSGAGKRCLCVKRCPPPLSLELQGGLSLGVALGSDPLSIRNSLGHPQRLHRVRSRAAQHHAEAHHS